MNARPLIVCALAIVGACTRDGPSRVKRSANCQTRSSARASKISRAAIRSRVPSCDRTRAFSSRCRRPTPARSQWLRGVMRGEATVGRAERSLATARRKRHSLILQHTQLAGFQEEMLPTLDSAAARGERCQSRMSRSSPIACACGRAKVEIYGNAFSVKDGQLVPDSVDDVAHVEERRASIGLPPISESHRCSARCTGCLSCGRRSANRAT